MTEELGALRVSLGLDSADFKQGMDQISRKLRAVDSEFKVAAASGKLFDGSMGSLQTRAENLGRKLELQKAAASELGKQYEKLKRDQGENAAATEKALIAYNKAVAAMTRTENTIKGVNEQIEKQSSTWSKLQKEVSQSVQEIDGKMKLLSSEFKAASAGIENFGRSSEDLYSQSQHLANVLELQRDKVSQLKRLYDEAANGKEKDSQATRELAIAYNEAAVSMKKTESQLQQVNRQIDQQAPSWNKITGKIQEVGQRMQDLGGRMQSIGSEIAMSFGAMSAGIGAGLAFATNKAMDFEAQLSSIKAVSGASSEQMEQFKDLAMELGAETKYSSLEAAQAIEELVKAGVSLEDVMNGGLKGALSLATAGELDLAQAAEIASTALNAFKDDNLSVSKAADILAGSANAAATNVTEMQMGLSQVSAVASGLGLSFKDTATALALFSNNGLKGSDAGTSLKTMLSNLIPKSDDAYATMKQLGIISFDTQKALVKLKDMGIKPTSDSFDDIMDALGKYVSTTFKAKEGTAKFNKHFEEVAQNLGVMDSAFFDANGEIESMSTIAGVLQKALQGLNSEQRQQAMYTMFGSDAIRAANILYKEGAQGIRDMAQEMSKTTAAEVAAERMNNLKGKIEELKGAFETAAITVGNALIPTITKLTEGIQKAVDWFNNLSPAMQEALTIGAGFATVMTGLVAAFGIGLSAIGMVTTGIGALVEAGGLAALSMGGLSAVFGILTNPITLTIAAIAGLSLAMIKVSNDFEKAHEPADRFGDKVSKGTKKAAEAFIELRDQASINLARLRTATGQEAEKLVAETVAIFGKMGDEIAAELEKDKIQIEKASASLMGKLPEEIRPAVEMQTEIVKKNIEQQMKTITEAQQIVAEGIRKYNGDISKMPDAFAENYQKSMQNLDKTSVVFVKKLTDLKAFQESIVSDQGQITAKGAQDWIKQIQDTYSHAEEAAKKWSSNQKKIYEEAFANGEMDKATYDNYVKMVNLAYDQMLVDAKMYRADNYRILQEGLSEEAQLYNLKTGERSQQIKDYTGQELETEKQHKERMKQLNAAYFSSLIQDSEKSRNELRKNQADMIKEFGLSGSQSMDSFIKAVKDGGEKAKIAVKTLGVQTAEGFRIDLGDKGLVTVDSFVKGLQSGEYKARDVAIAHMNQLRTIYGSGQFTPEGIKAIESFTAGLQSQKPQEIADQLGLDLKSKMNIDLGPYGQTTAQSFVDGLSNGSFGFDAVYTYFRTTLQQGMTFDLSAEGQKNIETLKLGMQAGAMDLTEVAALLGLNLESAVQIDLSGKGKQTVESLLLGLESGKISVEQFGTGISELIKSGATVDLTAEGANAANSMADGLESAEADVKEAADGIKTTTEQTLSGTTDGGGGKKAGDAYNQGLQGTRSLIENTASQHKSSVEQTLGSSTDGGGGKKAGDTYYQGLQGTRSLIENSATQNKASVEKTLGSTTDGQGGKKAGTTMSEGLSGTRALIQSSATGNKTTVEKLLGGTTDGGGGQKAGKSFGTGISSQKGYVSSMAVGLGESAKSGLKVDTTSMGVNFSSGFISGIGSKIGDAISAGAKLAASALKAAKDALVVRSPSRLMMEVGEFFGEGFAIGIKNSTSQVVQASRELTKSAVPDLREDIQLSEWQLKEMTRISKVEAKERYQAVEQWLSKQRELEYITSKDEVAIWQYVTDNFVLNNEEKRKSQLKLRDAKRTIDQNIFNDEKKWIEERKRLNQLSLTEELEAWEQVASRYAEGSSERLEAEQQAANVRKSIYDELKKASDDYLAKVKEVNDNVAKEEQRLNEVYEQAVEQRTKSIQSFAGIFDEIKLDKDVTGTDLLNNLEDQVSYLEDWMKNIQELTNRGIDEGLLKELQDMGPKAGQEIAALVKLSDEQLSEYQSLWLTKNQLARTQAVTELTGLRTDTDSQIQQLHTRSAEQLEELRIEFVTKAQNIRFGTEAEFDTLSSTLPGVGRNAIQGLMVGMDEMTPALMAQARAIAAEIRRTIASALDINSPSKVMAELGQWIPIGLAEGMKSKMGAVIQAANQMAQASIPKASAYATGSPTSVSNTYNPQITNVFQQPMSPSDVARKNLQLQRQLAVEWGMA